MTIKKTYDTYLVYDAYDNDRLIHICDSTKEVAYFLKINYETVKSALLRGGMIGYRYKLSRENFNNNEELS